MGQPYEKFNTFHEKINAVFQFMINNTDWDITMLRNLKLMEQEDGKLVPLPYDFDFSTFVRAPYRRPNQDVGQSVKMERVYMGKVATGREMIPISVYFRSKKNALINKILDFNLLYPEIQSEMVQYLEEFFELIKDNDGLERVYFPKKVTSQ
jgi:hypothetical protein